MPAGHFLVIRKFRANVNIRDVVFFQLLISEVALLNHG